MGSIANYILEFVNCLLLSLRVEANGGVDIKIFNDYFNTSELLKEVQKMMSPLASLKESYIRVEGDPKDNILTDKTKLTQIVINFVGNSIKFTTKGTILLKHERISRGIVKFTVQDTGSGMTEDVQKKLFLPFNSFGTKTNKNTEGIGLGKPHFPLFAQIQQA